MAGLDKQKESALQVDLYELTMSAGYFQYRPATKATFDLFVRPSLQQRNYYIFMGLGNVLCYLKNLRFNKEDIEYLKKLELFPDTFLKYLKTFRFTGDVWAIPEGTVFFPDEPVIRVTAPIIEAQIIESALLNMVNLQITLATKASRIVYSAGNRPVYDFSLRRTQGKEASLMAAKCSYAAGCAGTAHVLAGKLYQIPVVGTMAHSYVMSFASELASFRAYANIFPNNTVLLIDTYDENQGLRNAIIVAKELEKKGHRLRGIRMDSGDLAAGSRRIRRVLNEAGLKYVDIFASGDLDEYKIIKLTGNKSSINNFGVGTHMGTSSDRPYTDVVYKISELEDGQGRFLPTMKLSRGKNTLPGKKQIYRLRNKTGKFRMDIVGLAGEKISDTQALLIKVINKGRIIYNPPPLTRIRAYCRQQVLSLPEKYRRIDNRRPYPVIYSKVLKNLSSRIKKSLYRTLCSLPGPAEVFMDIDTQYDFMNDKGKLPVPGADKIISRLKQITEFGRKKKILIIASMDKHVPDDVEFKRFPPHCVAGTRGQQKIPETRLKKMVVLSGKKKYSEKTLRTKIKGKEQIVLETDTLSIFSNPSTEMILKDVIHVYLYGVATEYCVKEAAQGLVARGIKTTIIIDGVKPINPGAGKKAKQKLKKMGVDFIATAELLKKIS